MEFQFYEIVDTFDLYDWFVVLRKFAENLFPERKRRTGMAKLKWYICKYIHRPGQTLIFCLKQIESFVFTYKNPSGFEHQCVYDEISRRVLQRWNTTSVRILELSGRENAITDEVK